MFKGGDSFKHIKDLPPAFNRQHADHSVVLPDFTLNLYSHTHTHVNIICLGYLNVTAELCMCRRGMVRIFHIF